MEKKKVEEVIEERGRAKKEKNDLIVVRHLKTKKKDPTPALVVGLLLVSLVW